MAGVQGGSTRLLSETLSTALHLSPHPGFHASRAEGQEGKGQHLTITQTN